LTSIEKTKDTELIYGNLLETIDVGFYQVSLDGQMLNHNRAHNIILGYDPSENFESINVRHFWQNPEDRDEYVEYLLNYGFTKNYICHALTKNGENIIVELNSHMIRDEDGKPIRIDGTFIDITEKFNLQRKLEESEEKYRLLAENINDIIVGINSKFQIEYINEEVHKNILGNIKANLLGKNVLDFIHPDDKVLGLNSLLEGIKDKEGIIEIRVKHRDGHYLWFEVKGKAFLNDKGDLKGILIARDITKRKIADEKLKRSEKDYREAYDRAHFYRDLFAHDINNILHIISSSAELISYHLGDSEKSKVIEDIGNIINKQVERFAKLVSNVHTLSKLEEEEMHALPTEICKLMENAIDFVKKSHNGRIININSECAEDHVIINANELLQDVFENILLNAVKYNENSNVEIMINVSKTQIGGKNYNKIEFIDNGIGVPDERKQIIFKRGNRELKGAKGMGLGLSLVKKILKTFNGKIWVEDKVKGDFTQGSNFIVLLPELDLVQNV